DAPNSRTNTKVAMRTAAIARSALGASILKKLAPWPVIGHVLLKRIQLAAELVHAPLQQTAYGKNPQQLAIIISHRQMPEMARQHDAERLACTGLARCHLHRGSHEIADGAGLRIQARERHFAQHVTLSEDACDAVLTIHDGNRAH